LPTAVLRHASTAAFPERLGELLDELVTELELDEVTLDEDELELVTELEDELVTLEELDESTCAIR
jgi:hypothetical protein